MDNLKVTEDEIEAFIAGDPVGNPKHYSRPILDKAGIPLRNAKGRIMMQRFMPTKTQSGDTHPIVRWRQTILIVAQQAVAKGFRLIRRPSPVHLYLEFYFLRPKSKPKKEGMAHTSKPDLDNLEKAVCDAFNRVLYEDDAQVDTVFKHKEYVWDEPGLFIRLKKGEGIPYDTPKVARYHVSNSRMASAL